MAKKLIELDDKLLEDIRTSASNNERSVNAEIRYLIKLALSKLHTTPV